MSTFERAGVTYLDKSWKRLKIVIDGKEYFVRLKDLHYALNKNNFQMNVFQLAKSSSVQVSSGVSKQNLKQRRVSASFSVVFNEESENQTRRNT
jgi:hypothetical protein